MNDEQREDGSLDRVVAQSIVRLRRLWPHALDGPELIAEYRRVLSRAPDPATLAGVVDAVIDAEADYLPRPAVFVMAISEAAKRKRRESVPHTEGHSRRWIDEAALRDSLAFLQECDTAEDVEYAEEQIRAIRMRLPDHGASAEEGQAVHFTRSPAKYYDQPGTIRYRVTQIGGGKPWPEDEDWPRGPLNGGTS